MKLGKYLWDKIIHIIVYVTLSVLIVMLLNAFKVNNELITAVIVLLSAAGTVLLFIDFVRKRRFYNNIIHKLEELDKKYLITEVVTPESFYERNSLPTFYTSRISQWRRIYGNIKRVLITLRSTLKCGYMK